jgi:cytochrome c oxidase cbb3-type subunit III
LSSQKDLLSDHAYDGIQEYDNPLPGWWKWLFVLTCIFSVVYWVYFHSGVDGRGIHAEYDRHVAQVMLERFGDIGVLEATEEQLLAAMYDPEFDKYLKVGESTFKTNCVQCHGVAGEGGVGPNMTDDHYKTIKELTDIVRVIENGAANGAMPPWKTRFSHPNVTILTAAYVAKMRGTNVAGGKSPEGTVIPPWPKYVPQPKDN